MKKFETKLNLQPKNTCSPITIFRFRRTLKQWRRTLRSVDIIFDSRRVLPGETLTGNVVVKTDKEFECNRVVLKVVSKERTEVGSGDSRRVDEKHIVSRVFRISEGGIIQAGTTSFPFSYNVPRGLAPSYKGYYGWIKHTVEGVVEVDWALDPKMTIEYRVIQNRPPCRPEIVDTKAISETENGLYVQLNENCVRLDSGILVGFKVDDRKRMRAVRFDIMKLEDVKCGWSKTKHHSSVQNKYYELNPDDWGRWQEIQIGEDWRHNIPFKSLLFHLSYYLKVTLEIDWGSDPEIIIPLTISDSAPEEDVLDEIAKDLGLDDW
ncbi:hypothetical protein E4H12_07640 [Candidatus Thorarchaeota archaeon]|nr:MAG: hypothetical protein E4H12_07640 [Candidatus Thorarchaeota archaeon]